ncbi:hypothetical protein HK096_009376, partial [Nowakowskiella sp. JEL0078]
MITSWGNSFVIDIELPKNENMLDSLNKKKFSYFKSILQQLTVIDALERNIGAVVDLFQFFRTLDADFQKLKDFELSKVLTKQNKNLEVLQFGTGFPFIHKFGFGVFVGYWGVPAILDSLDLDLFDIFISGDNGCFEVGIYSVKINLIEWKVEIPYLPRGIGNLDESEGYNMNFI